ncbi:MAG: MFS transporter [Actinomycetota bacterium]
MAEPVEIASTPNGRANWVGFGAVVASYLAVTVAESVLAPLFPAVATDLGLGAQTAGLAFGILTGLIAVGNFLGGLLLRHLAPRAVAALSLGITAVGSALAAMSHRANPLLFSQALIGFGAGLFFAPALKAAGLAAGTRRRGLAMGIFGVAFSAGLALAAYLAASTASRWNTAFFVAAATCVAGLVVVVVAPWPDSRQPDAGKLRLGAIRLPVVVGSVGAVSQYGTVGFLALFAVTVWGLSPASAAVLVATGRLLSVPAKLAVGSAADRFGGRTALVSVVLVLAVTGALWTSLPNSAFTLVAAAIFAASVSALFPVANLIAFERFGDQGSMLGAYRSVQIGVGAVGAFLVGLLADVYGLRFVLTVSALIPILLLLVARRMSPAVAI